jgi:hypothetical protein
MIDMDFKTWLMMVWAIGHGLKSAATCCCNVIGVVVMAVGRQRGTSNAVWSDMHALQTVLREKSVIGELLRLVLSMQLL